jgi:segregation and condensation protein A
MYQVKLQEFEGPLDLLLFFIRKDELDIYDIPISRITDQFIDYLHLMRELDLTVAAEFIWMASMLMSIKAKMMLPRQEQDDDEQLDETDPRYELVQALLEYKKYKEAGASLRTMDLAMRTRYFRGYTEIDKTEPVNDGEILKNVTLIDLMTAIRGVMKRFDTPPVVHKVEKVKTSIEDQMEFLITHLREKGRAPFIAICKSLPSREYVVVTFLAMLELVRMQRLRLFADESVHEFEIEYAA